MEELFAIVSSGDLDGLNFRHLRQKSAKTVRKSLDGSQAIISYYGIRAPEKLDTTIDVQIITDRAQILNILNRLEKVEGNYKNRYFKRRFDRDTKTLIERVLILNKKRQELKLITRTTTFPDNVNADFETIKVQKDPSGNIIRSRVIAANTSVNYLRDTTCYTKDEIKDILTGADWSRKEPRPKALVPNAGSDGEVVSVSGQNMYYVTGVELNGVRTQALNPNPETVRFQVPPLIGDGKVILLNRFDSYNTNLNFNYIYIEPSIINANISFIAQRGTFGLVINGMRLMNVAIVNLEPTINQDNLLSYSPQDFTIHNNNRIAINIPDKIVETYNLKLIDKEGREIVYPSTLDKTL